MTGIKLVMMFIFLFKLHDHSEYAWVEKEKLLKYDLAPADIPLAKYVEENII